MSDSGSDDSLRMNAEAIKPPAKRSQSQSMSVLPAVEPSSEAALLYPRSVARYQRIRALGAGGNGEVDLWQDQDIDRAVAVKRLKPRAGSEPLAQFVREIQTTGQLEHPGIVPIYDVGIDEQGNYFFVMKHAEGETLEQIIAKLKADDPDYKRRFSYETRTQIFMQVLRAVQYAHRKGFLHCDIKPANVIVGPFGEVMVLDWGLARRGNAVAKSPSKPSSRLQICGTPEYMSPEQAMGEDEPLDARTDTYCLCVLFHELVTLHDYLKPSSTVVARMTAILSEEPISALEMHHRYGAPPELTNFIRYGLAKQAAQRYQTVDEMIEKLQNVIDGLIPVVCPCTGVKRFAHHYGDFLNEQPNIGIAILCLLVIFTMFGMFEAVRHVLQVFV